MSHAPPSSSQSGTSQQSPTEITKPPDWVLSQSHNEDNTLSVPASAHASVAPASHGATSSLSSLSRETSPMTSPNDFKYLKELGRGSWSMVMEAIGPVANKHYAVKILSKALLIKEKKVKYAGVEKNALVLLGSGNHPGIVRLYSTFQDSTSLYFVLALAPNGDLGDLLRKYGSLSLLGARYYTAQIVDAVLWMHSRGVLHRDLKPENVLLDSDMRVKLTDFGSAYIAEDLDLSPRASTFVGSAAYVSPELLNRAWKSTSRSSDYWAIGCIVYFLVAGVPPFLAVNEYQSFRKIEALDYIFPEGFYTDAKDIVQRLLVLSPADRLGMEPKSSPSELRQHPFFAGHGSSSDESPETCSIDWDTLWNIPAVPIETGIMPPAPPQVWDNHHEEDRQQFWDNVVHEFSLVDLEKGSCVDGRGDLHHGPSPHSSGTLDSCAKPIVNGGKGGVGNVAVEGVVDEPSSDTWSTFLGPSESLQLVTQAETRIRRGLFKQTRHCTLLLTSLPRLICVISNNHPPKKDPGASDSSTQIFTLPPTRAPGSVCPTPKHEIVSVKSRAPRECKLILRTTEKQYVYDFRDREALARWAAELQSFLDLRTTRHS